MPQGTLITWSLAGTFLVHGDVTGYEYEDLVGVTVTAKNLTTGDEGTDTVDEDGSYSIDIGDTTPFPGGYSIGDEIQLTVTHRDVTRTWKRRVAGSEIIQDLYFTHGTFKGSLVKAKLLVIDTLTSNSGFTVTIRDTRTRDILRVWKNGDLLAAAEWTFTKPNTLTLDDALSTTDVIEVERALDRSIQQAKDAIVTDGDSIIRNAMARHYPSPLPQRVPELQDLSESLAASALRHRLYSGAEDVDAEASNLWTSSQSMLSELRKGERNLTDHDGAYIAPSNKSTTTPQSSVSVTRRATRWTDDHEKVDLLS